MINQLERINFNKMNPLLKKYKLENHISLTSILKGHSRGKIFVDNLERPTSALIWAINCMYFFVGDPNNHAFNQDFLRFFSQDLAPENLSLGARAFICTFLQEDTWQETVKDYFKEKTLDIDYRQEFSFNRNHKEHLEKKPDFSDLAVKMITPDLFENNKNPLLSEDICEFWYTLDDFFKKGLGFCLLKNNQILSSCYACYASDQGLEINIITYDEKDRKKGYAKIVAWAFIQHCLRHDLSFRWEAYENSPSSALAEKLGFEKKKKYLCYELNF
jgi:RimJ/RimL family protein N-acetyltransferase